MSKQTVEKEVKNFLKKNPSVQKALKIFDISNEQYERAVLNEVHFVTRCSSNDRAE